MAIRTARRGPYSGMTHTGYVSELDPLLRGTQGGLTDSGIRSRTLRQLAGRGEFSALPTLTEEYADADVKFIRATILVLVLKGDAKNASVCSDRTGVKVDWRENKPIVRRGYNAIVSRDASETAEWIFERLAQLIAFTGLDLQVPEERLLKGAAARLRKRPGGTIQEQIAVLHSEGYINRDIAGIIGRHNAAVTRGLKAMGLAPNRRPTIRKVTRATETASDEILIHMAVQGFSNAEIARRMGRDQSTVAARRRGLGLESSVISRERLAELHESGMSDNEIARAVGANQSGISKRLRAMGLKPNGRKRVRGESAGSPECARRG